MKKIAWLTACLCFCAVILVGCGEAKLPDIIETPTVSFTKEGEVLVWLVGEFDKNYYELGGLNAMAAEEVAKYCSAKGRNAAAVDEAQALHGGSKVVLPYRFDGWESCGEFLGNQIFFGTVAEAIQKGYDMDVVMRSVDGDVLLTETQLRQAGDRYLVITDMAANIYCPRKVTHISNNALVNEDGSINPSMVEGPVYILLK